MKKILSICIALITLMGCKVEDTLETQGGISGRVLEAGTNKPLSYAIVSISKIGQTFTTGAEGTYIFNELPEGEYTVLASKQGYGKKQQIFTVKAGQTLTGDFLLEQEFAGLQLSTRELDFGMTLDKQTFDILKDEGTAALEWNIEKQGNADWVSVSETSGTLIAPRATITVSIDRTLITEERTYSTQLIIRSKSGGAATLRVIALKKGAMIVAEPTSIDFGNAETEKTIILKNVNNDGAITYKAKSTESWLTIPNAEGTLSKDAVATIKVVASRIGLSPSSYTGNIIISSTRNTLTIPVALTVVAKSKPEVSNIQTSEVRHNSLNVSAYISSIGSSAITSYGFCWSQSNTQPTTADSKNALGGTTSEKSYNATLAGLTPNTLYYVRGYAINEEGVAYSDPVQVKTLPQPTYPSVKTLQSESVKHNKATIHGNINDLGDGYVTSYGFCYSTSNNNPTINDSKADLGSITNVGDFEAEIKDLQPETTYYVRAFAKNSIGVAYGGTITIKTQTAPPAVVSGLIVYYTFDEQNCDDRLGDEDYSGVVQGTGGEMSFVKDTPDGKGFALKGSNGGKYYKILRAPEEGKRTISYSIWIKTKATSTTFYGISNGEGRHGAPARNTDMNGSMINLNNGKVSIWSDPTYYWYSSFSLETNDIISNGVWNHLVIILKGGEAQLYINGRFYEKTNFSRSESTNFIRSLIGLGDGIIDNLRIYNRVLTQDEVKEIYRAKQ